MITEIDLTRLRKPEFLQFMEQVSRLSTDNGNIPAPLAESHSALTTQIEELRFFFGLRRGNALTPEMALLDKERGAAMSSVKATIAAGLLHFDENKKAAARLLSDTLRLFGPAIQQQNYQAQTAILTSLTKRLEEDPALSNAVGILGLAEMRDYLRDKNMAFNKKFLDRNISEASKKKGSFSTQRIVAAAAYYDLMEKLSAVSILYASDTATGMVNDINALIDGYNGMIAIRSNKGKSGDA